MASREEGEGGADGGMRAVEISVLEFSLAHGLPPPHLADFRVAVRLSSRGVNDWGLRRLVLARQLSPDVSTRIASFVPLSFPIFLRDETALPRARVQLLNLPDAVVGGGAEAIKSFIARREHFAPGSFELDWQASGGAPHNKLQLLEVEISHHHQQRFPTLPTLRPNHTVRFLPGRPTLR